ncbi:MAG TPA: hypothetical protein VL463_13120 [Kofleriaceae bacterium]|nr:hypothetical protein [Kofleriaceae bacterium]
MYLRKMLMNAVDASPGNGAVQPAASATAPISGTPAAPTSTPAQPQAQGGADFAEALAAAEKRIRDSMYADLRRRGLLKDDKPGTSGAAAPSTDTPPPTQQTAQPVDVQAMVKAALARQGSFNRMLNAYDANTAQAELVERMFTLENPSDADIASWVKSIADGMGLKPRGQAPAPSAQAAPATPPVPPTQPPQAANAVPITSGGSAPPPTGVNADKFTLATSEADFKSYQRTHGNAKVIEHAKASLKGIKLVPGGGTP